MLITTLSTPGIESPLEKLGSKFTVLTQSPAHEGCLPCTSVLQVPQVTSFSSHHKEVLIDNPDALVFREAANISAVGKTLSPPGV